MTATFLPSNSNESILLNKPKIDLTFPPSDPHDHVILELEEVMVMILLRLQSHLVLSFQQTQPLPLCL